MCRLIPRAIVTSKADQWCFLFASTAFNRCTAARVPRVSLSVVSGAANVAVAENRTALLLSVDFTLCYSDERQYFRRTLGENALWDGWKAVIPISVPTDQKGHFCQAIQWRSDSVRRFRDELKEEPTTQKRWYTVIPLDSQDGDGKYLYDLLAPFKLPVVSGRRTREPDRTSLDADDDLEDDDNLLVH